jgi:hypothetical protein
MPWAKIARPESHGAARRRFSPAYFVERADGAINGEKGGLREHFMRKLARFVGAMLTVLAGPAMAGTFDGDWIGQIPPSGHCHAVAIMTITVSGDTLTGVVHNVGNIRQIAGKIDEDGNGTFSALQFHYTGTIKFTADHFDANWNSGDCQRHSLGDRAPDSAQSAALIGQRTRAQATYADLIAKADAGDRSVDFTALRAAYPYTEQWDAFSRLSGPLMAEAKAAAKGKDCATALEKLDEVLKIDFTVIVAHRVRSDCLKGDAARIESRIADGLMDSLTRGGNGKIEDTAYPVMTVHEENDILGEKHILLKTREVEVRGSNGHFYDVVHGVSLWNGVQVQDVYFDVTTEVNARSSGMVAAEAVASAAP